MMRRRRNRNPSKEQRERQPPQIGPTLYERCAAAAVEAVQRAVTAGATSTVTPTLSSRHSIKRTNSTSNNAALRSIAVDYQSLPTNVKVDLLERSLVQQQLPPMPTSAEKRMNGISSNHNNNNKADIDMSVVDEVKQQLKRVYVKKLDKYKSILEKKREEIQAYEEELSKFQRVPITHRIPPLLTSGQSTLESLHILISSFSTRLRYLSWLCKSRNDHFHIGKDGY
jgi:hypothetical protein